MQSQAEEEEEEGTAASDGRAPNDAPPNDTAASDGRAPPPNDTLQTHYSVSAPPVCVCLCVCVRVCVCGRQGNRGGLHARGAFDANPV